MSKKNGTLCLLLVPSIILALFLSPSPPLDATPIIRGRHNQALLAPPHYGKRLRFYRKKSSIFSSVVDSRRFALIHAIKTALGFIASATPSTACPSCNVRKCNTRARSASLHKKVHLNKSTQQQEAACVLVARGGGGKGGGQT